MKKNKRIIAIVSVIAIIIYIVSAIYLLIADPTETYVIKQGTLSEEDEAVGYIIRNEKVIKGENYDNGIYAIASEGQKVAKDESIFRYYSDSEKEITNQIAGLNYKIQELLEQEKNPPSADIKAIENQIEEKISKINLLNNYQEINEYKKDIDNLISKKIQFIGDVTENTEIKQLINEKKSYENKLKSGSEYLTAKEMSGIVSYRVDGLEEKLTINNFDELTDAYLNEIELKTGQIISTSDECGKIIDNFKCYIAVTLNSKEAMNAKVNDDVQIRISNTTEEDAKIIQINEQSGKRTIIFELSKMTEELIKHRKIAIDVIWWDTSGLKVPNQALIQENGLYYVIRNKAGIETKLLVNVKRKTDKFSIISPYKDEELKELGYDSTQIKNYRKISNYDEIMINK